MTNLLKAEAARQQFERKINKLLGVRASVTIQIAQENGKGEVLAADAIRAGWNINVDDRKGTGAWVSSPYSKANPRSIGATYVWFAEKK